MSRGQAGRVFERFDGEARSVITRAQERARELRHNFIGTEHLLLGLEGTAGGDVLAGLGADFAALRAAVVELIGASYGASTGPPAFTPRAKKVLELSLREALARGDRSIRPEHILLGIVREGEGVGCQVLAEAGITQAQLTPVLGEATRSRARRFRRGGVVMPGMVLNATPAAGRLELMARALAGAGPVGTQHYLIALLNDENSLATKVLEALGVTKEAVAEKAEELGPAGTSDAPPNIEVAIGDQTFDVTEDQAEQLRKWLAGEGPPPAVA